MTNYFEQRRRQPDNLEQRSGICDTTFSFLWPVKKTSITVSDESTMSQKVYRKSLEYIVH